MQCFLNIPLDKHDHGAEPTAIAAQATAWAQHTTVYLNSALHGLNDILQKYFPGGALQTKASATATHRLDNAGLRQSRHDFPHKVNCHLTPHRQLPGGETFLFTTQFHQCPNGIICFAPQYIHHAYLLYS
jgi:hypothetical protein